MQRKILIVVMCIGALCVAMSAIHFTGWLSAFMWAMTGLIVAGIYGNIVGNSMGINFEPVVCPNCKTPAPAFRKPTSFRQIMWGGWTCTKCGTEMDKWGHAVERKTAPQA